MSQSFVTDTSSLEGWLSVTPESMDEPAGRLRRGSAPHPTPANDPLIGATLHDTYTIEHVIGEGGMGRIYHARHARVETKHFAIKVLRQEVLPSPQVRARFRREAEAVASIDHPGVVSVVDVGTAPEGAPYLVCERLHGMDLAEYSRRFGLLSDERIIDIGKQLCAALTATHAVGVIHRDLKPSNVFLLGRFHDLDAPLLPRLKILDFGLSRFVEKEDQLSQTGLVLGTPGYMSPEQAQGQRGDPRTDVYGAGAVLYAAATRRAPFRESTPQKTVLAVLNAEPITPRKLNPALSPGLAAVILRALSRNPDDRFQSMQELAAALAALDAEGYAAPQEKWEPSQRRSSRQLWAARARALGWGSTALGLLVAGAVSATESVLSALDGGVRARAQVAALGAAAGACIVPGLWAGLRAARVWSHGGWLSAWSARTRSVLFSSVFALGLGTLLLCFADVMLAPRLQHTVLAPVAHAGWWGWRPLLFAFALCCAAAEAVEWRSRVRRRGALTLVAAALLGGGVFGAYMWSARAAARGEPMLSQAKRGALRDGSAAKVVTSSPPPTLAVSQLRPWVPPSNTSGPTRHTATVVSRPAVGEAPLQGADAERGADAEQAPGRRERATPEELTAAVARGAQALEELALRYPRDADVLHALVLAHSSRAPEIGEAVAAIVRLVAVQPERGRQADVRYILTRAAQRGGEPAKAAFEAMSLHMGAPGLELLFDLLRKEDVSQRAAAMLAEPATRARFTPELSVAYALRFAPTCASRLPLLERAVAEGDQRSINILSALISRPKSCRRGDRRRSCRVRCRKHAEAFQQAIDGLVARLRGKPAASQ